jgi:hypothetical protein
MNESKGAFKLQLKYAFYFECFLNATIVIICLFFPRFFLQSFAVNNPSVYLIEIIRWYAILLFVITAILFGMLINQEQKGTEIVLTAYLMGDVGQIIATILFSVNTNNWSFAAIFTIAITVVLIAFRVIVLVKPQSIGFDNKKKEKNESSRSLKLPANE